MTDEKLNEIISLLCERNFLDILADTGPSSGAWRELPEMFKQAGKPIFYIGWYWREVGFEHGLILGYCTPADMVGFMQSNKWGYPSLYIEGEAAEGIRTRLVEIARKYEDDTLTITDLAAFHGHLQSFKGDWCHLRDTITDYA